MKLPRGRDPSHEPYVLLAKFHEAAEAAGWAFFVSGVLPNTELVSSTDPRAIAWVVRFFDHRPENQTVPTAEDPAPLCPEVRSLPYAPAFDEQGRWGYATTDIVLETLIAAGITPP